MNNNNNNSNLLTNSITKNDSQKNLQNNLMNSYDPKQVKVIDYSKDNYMPNRSTNFSNYNNFGNNQSNKPPQTSNSTNVSTDKPKTSTFLKDYQSEMKKPQMGANQSNSYTLMSKSKTGPVKIQNEDYDKKSDQLINNFTLTNKKTGGNNFISGNNISPINNYSSNNQMLGTIKRSNSKPSKEERPSTAPAKDNKNQDKNLTNNSSLKRLPSPAVKSNTNSNLLSNTVKNYPTSGSSKYRSQSPAIPLKANTINNNKIGMSNSLKGMPVNSMMKKWK